MPGAAASVTVASIAPGPAITAKSPSSTPRSDALVNWMQRYAPDAYANTWFVFTSDHGDMQGDTSSLAQDLRL